jgi:hypothetical protein
VVYYPYQIISDDPMVPPAPILRVELFNPIQDSERRYELDALLDTGADCTLIPLEALSVLRLPLLGDRFPVQGVGGATTTGFLCQAGIHVGLTLPALKRRRFLNSPYSDSQRRSQCAATDSLKA